MNVTVVVDAKSLPLMNTVVPGGPLVGANEVTVGMFSVTTKSVALMPVPFEVVTEILPVLAPAGTVAFRTLLLWRVELAETPLNLTAMTLLYPLPSMVTSVPTGPLVGVKLATVGAFAGCCTMKSVALVAVPEGVETVMRPEIAPFGMVVVIWVAESTV